MAGKNSHGQGWLERQKFIGNKYHRDSENAKAFYRKNAVEGTADHGGFGLNPGAVVRQADWMDARRF
jgi:hypothetical protein